MLTRERPRAPADVLPAPAPLPSLRDALQRRAALFGPVEAEPALAASHEPWQALGDLARRIVDTLAPSRALA